MIIRESFKNTKELDKFLKESNISISQCQIVHTVSKFGGTYHVFYDEPGDTENVIDLSGDENDQFRTFDGSVMCGPCHDFESEKGQPLVVTVGDSVDAKPGMVTAVKFKTAYKRKADGSIATGNSYAMLDCDQRWTDSVELVALDSESRETLADALETAAARLRMFGK